jgi:hypothetical protein
LLTIWKIESNWDGGGEERGIRGNKRKGNREVLGGTEGGAGIAIVR